MYELVLTRRRVLAGALAALVVLLLGTRFLLHGAAAPAKLERPIVGSAEVGAGEGGGAAPGGSSRLVVYVVGAVRRPGLYRLPGGARVADAVSRAGGLTRKADPAGVNLAAPVADGEQLVVPARLPVEVAAAQGAPVPGVGSAAAGPVQLSVATVEQLDALPGIGPVTAQKIVDYRTAHGAFRSVDELDEVPGIGPARVEQLRGLVVP
ncbi:MAG TPA: ComEA family DNA-binding protein [Gaiellaceae bacterium]|nr:ComEA family DNA-binding protein [Gaiellaceae bacterium]